MVGLGVGVAGGLPAGGIRASQGTFSSFICVGCSHLFCLNKQCVNCL